MWCFWCILIYFILKSILNRMLGPKWYYVFLTHSLYSQPFSCQRILTDCHLNIFCHSVFQYTTLCAVTYIWFFFQTSWTHCTFSRLFDTIGINRSVFVLKWNKFHITGNFEVVLSVYLWIVILFFWFISVEEEESTIFLSVK